MADLGFDFDASKIPPMRRHILPAPSPLPDAAPPVAPKVVPLRPWDNPPLPDPPPSAAPIEPDPGYTESEAEPPELGEAKDAPENPQEKPAASPKTMRIIDPRGLQGLAVPERLWIVFGLLPVGYTTLLYGDGGTGKSLLTQQLMTSCAIGRPWLGIATTQCRVFALFCEDDEAELHRRQEAINSHYGVDYLDLENMQWVSGVGADNLLVTFDKTGKMKRQPLFEELKEAAIVFGAKLVIIDTAADTFGGNENDRSQVRQFIGEALNNLAQAIGGAVLLCAHPSRTGMGATGDGDGASTGWNNTARSRLSLVRPKESEGVAADVDERILSCRKSNYGRIGDAIKLRYQGGVFVPLQPAGAFTGSGNTSHAQAVFLELLDDYTKSGRKLSHSKNATTYAPKIFAKRENRRGCTRHDFEAAMDRLITDGKIIIQSYRSKSREHEHLVRAPAPDAEAEGRVADATPEPDAAPKDDPEHDPEDGVTDAPKDDPADPPEDGIAGAGDE